MCYKAIPPYLEQQEKETDLKAKEAQYAPAEPIYHQYNDMLDFYNQAMELGNVINHPNDQLVAFMEELETKILQSACVLEFTSMGDMAVIKFQANDYEEAAKIIEEDTMKKMKSIVDIQ